MKKTRSWSDRTDEPLVHHMNDKRMSVTVYGAIGNCLNDSVFTLGTSTNEDEFIKFVR